MNYENKCNTNYTRIERMWTRLEKKNQLNGKTSNKDNCLCLFYDSIDDKIIYTNIFFPWFIHPHFE